MNKNKKEKFVFIIYINFILFSFCFNKLLHDVSRIGKMNSEKIDREPSDNNLTNNITYLEENSLSVNNDIIMPLTYIIFVSISIVLLFLIIIVVTIKCYIFHSKNTEPIIPECKMFSDNNNKFREVYLDDTMEEKNNKSLDDNVVSKCFW